MSYSKGVSWVADCRIPFVETDPLQNGISGRDNGKMDTNNQGWGFKRLDREPGLGRFTPNLLVCDDILNDGSVSEAKANLNYKWNNTDGGGDIFGNRGTYTPRNDKGTNSRYYSLDLWFDKMIEKL